MRSEAPSLSGADSGAGVQPPLRAFDRMVGSGRAHVLHAPGSGPPLLFLHGLLATSFCWRHTLPAVACCRDGYAVDLPGCGESAPLAGYRAPLSRLGAWAGELIRACGWRRVTVVGSSWGGAVALALALQEPELVDRLVLVGPVSPFFRPNWRQRSLLYPPLTRQAAGLRRRTPHGLYARGLAAMTAAAECLTPELIAGYRRGLGRSDLGAVLAGYAARWQRELEALGSGLGRIRMPTLAIWGDRDRVVPPASAAPLVAALPSARLAIIAGAGHMPFEERPGPFQRALLAFLPPGEPRRSAPASRDAGGRESGRLE